MKTGFETEALHPDAVDEACWECELDLTVSPGVPVFEILVHDLCRAAQRPTLGSYGNRQSLRGCYGMDRQQIATVLRRVADEMERF